MNNKITYQEHVEQKIKSIQLPVTEQALKQVSAEQLIYLNQYSFIIRDIELTKLCKAEIAFRLDMLERIMKGLSA